MEQTECSETSAYEIQTPGNYPKENIQQEIVSSPKPSRLAMGPTQPRIPWVVVFHPGGKPAGE
jgi:hypothetical protein